MGELGGAVRGKYSTFRQARRTRFTGTEAIPGIRKSSDSIVGTVVYAGVENLGAYRWLFETDRPLRRACVLSMSREHRHS